MPQEFFYDRTFVMKKGVFFLAHAQGQNAKQDGVNEKAESSHRAIAASAG